VLSIDRLIDLSVSGDLSGELIELNLQELTDLYEELFPAELNIPKREFESKAHALGVLLITIHELAQIPNVNNGR